VDYAKNSYHDEFIDFLPHISFHVPSHFSQGPDHCPSSYVSRKSGLITGCFGVDLLSHCGVVHLPCRHGFPARSVYSHVEPSRCDSQCFPIVVRVPLAQMVRCKGL
jgi:hypothetical protein